MDDPKLLGSLPDASASKEAVEELAPQAETEAMEGVESSKGSGKRKRARPSPRLHSKTPATKKEEEDVCFICFDGGKLVLCDHRGCLKAYHPRCVNQNEAFFQATDRWNCDWHICSICEKASQYMCYTCTYSLCKGCMKEAGLLCVRANKGFCETCMKTVMQIEKTVKANKQMVQVDFNDKNSWEYLFKEYWLDLKGKLSLTVEELTRARNPLKGSGPSGGLVHEEGSSDELNDANVNQSSKSDNSSVHIKASSSRKEKMKKRSRSFTGKGGLPSGKTEAASEGTSVPEDMEWASKELLEFVSHMKDGDMSVLSQSDVHALLLEYIKRNNLRNPRKKSQIKCDTRLQNLFGKASVGHLDMLKLLESHFFVKEAPQAFLGKTQGGSMDADAIQMETGGSSDAVTVTKTGFDKRRKSRKRIEERGPQTNLDDYAAINIHNINLIYLRRKLLEDLLVDMDKFQNKVVGSFVRIRISGTGQNQDMYRLVQVVGTEKATEAYTTGRKTTDITLEIVNLNMTEVISIDIISNQGFTEEECEHLCESIKCGLISRLKVGEVQEKARDLQRVRVSDWLETEMSRLSNLRDRASEKGRRKELRDCIQKLQLLSTPEERYRLLEGIPEVHADPKMDPSYVSDEDGGDQDEKKQDNYMRPRDAGFSRKGREPISPGKGGSNMLTKDYEGAKESSWNPGGDGLHSTDWETATVSETGASGANIPETVPAALTTVTEVSSDISDTDKVWHYQDPSGKIQGPFSLTQLCKWNNTGYFPTNLRIWKTSEKQEDSILLTDGLQMFQKEPPQWETQISGFSQLHSGITGYDSKGNNQEGGWSGSNNSTLTDNQKNDGIWKSNWNNASGPPNGNAESSKTDAWGTQSSGWITQASEIVSSKEEGWTGSSSRACDLSKSHSPGSPPFSGKAYQVPSHQGEEGREGDDSGPSGQNAGNSWNANRITGFESDNQGFEKPINSKGWEMPTSAVAPKLTTDVWGANQGSRNDLSNLPPTPKQSSGGWTGGQSQPTGSGWGTISSENDGANQTPTTVSASEKIATGWGTQACTSEKPTVGGWEDSNCSPASTHKQTVTVDGGRNDILNTCTPSPKPSCGGWAAAQGDENDSNTVAATMAASLDPTITAGWSTGMATKNPDTSLDATPENSNKGWGAAHVKSTNKGLEKASQGNAKVGWGTAEHGNADSGWGAAQVKSTNTGLETNSQGAKVGWGTTAPGNADAGWGVAQVKSTNTGLETNSQGNAKVGWGTAPGNADAGWGAAQVKSTNTGLETTSQGNAKVGWGTAAQGNADAGWGEAQVKSNTGLETTSQGNAKVGWGTAAQGNAGAGWGAAQVKSTNTGLETTSQGNAKVGWGTAAQGNADAGWGAASQGNANVGWGKEAVQGNNTNTGWGAKQGNTNTGWGNAAEGNTNVGWGSSSENSSKWGSQQKSPGERFSGHRDRGFHAGEGGGKPPWNRSMSSGDSGGPSRPPPRGQRVCKFHESGHCKKGASCDYLHN